MKSRSVDTHHFFFPRKDWNKGFAKVLRNHWYCRASITRKSHDVVHVCVSNVPMPSGKVCKAVFFKLLDLETEGRLKKSDSPVKRLSLMIELFRAISPGTAAVLDRQRNTLLKFYQGM